MDFLYVVYTSLVSIIVLFILSKIIGNKQMSSLNLFDYINGITIGSIAAEMAIGEKDEFWNCLIALVVYAVVVMILTWLSQKSIVLRRLFTGKAIVLYDKGKIYKRNFSTSKIDMNEFLTMLRDKGFFALDDVETVFLEQNGQMSVLPKESKRPVTPDDLKLCVHQTRAEVVVISDGKILEENLKSTGNNIKWLEKQLDLQKLSIKEVFAGVCDGNNNLKIYSCSDDKPSNDLFE